MKTSDKIQWLQWGREAFERAAREDKPILLSIGATWCQWCRVMEETTYADDEIASAINQHYIPIYVDNDRRPDVNDRYNMGGWPSTAFLTPRGELIAGATYIPPADMKRVLTELNHTYREKRAELDAQIQAREDRIKQVQIENYSPQAAITAQILQNTIRGISATYDPMHGGFGRAPKFPMAWSILLLEHVYADTGGPDFREMLIKTLDAMGDRGMYDQVEGGFFRYSVNDLWTLPHFEKMLEDQASLIRAYVTASQVFDEPRYARKAEHAIEYVIGKLCERDLGVFCGSQNADEAYYAATPEKRAGMTPPAVDRTVYVNWSAMMASTMIHAGAALRRPEWVDLARKGLATLWERGWSPEQGMCHYFDDGPRGHGLCRDAAWTAYALIDSYEVSGDALELDRAGEVLKMALDRFWSASENALLDRVAYPDDLGDMRRVIKNISESAVVAAALLRLASHRDQPRLRAKAWEILMAFPNYGTDYGHPTAEFAMAADRFAAGDREIHLVYRDAAGARPLIEAACGSPVPRRVVRHLVVGRDDKEIRARGFSGAHPPAAFVVSRGKTLPPAGTPAELAERLRE